MCSSSSTTTGDTTAKTSRSETEQLEEIDVAALEPHFQRPTQNLCSTAGSGDITANTSTTEAIQTHRELSSSSEPKEVSETDTTNLSIILASDPATWPNRLGDAERISLVNKGPPSPLYKHDFPQDNKGRRFTSLYYKRKLNNGEHVLREWLVYSTTKDAVYCFCCKIFNITTSLLSKDGYNKWKHVGDILKSHEMSKNMQKLKYPGLNLRTG